MWLTSRSLLWPVKPMRSATFLKYTKMEKQDPNDIPPTPGPQDIPQPVPTPVDFAGSGRPDILRFLNVRSISIPSLSPDGRSVSYITSTTGQPQLWVQSRDGSPPVQLTFGESSVTNQEWSPKGNWIAYVSDEAGTEREGYFIISPDGLSEQCLLTPGDDFRIWGGWSPDGHRIAYSSTARNGLDFDVYMAEVSDDGIVGPHQLVHLGVGSVAVVSWRPDGNALLLSFARGETDNDVMLLDLRDGSLRPIFQPEAASNYRGFAWTPDGYGFYLATNQDRDISSLAFYDVRTGDFRWVEEPSDEVEDVALSSDGRWLTWLLNENGFSSLHIRDLASDRDLHLNPPLPKGVYSLRLYWGYHGRPWSSGSSTLCVRVSSPSIAGDAWVIDAPAARSERATISATGGLDPIRMIEPEAVRFRSWDGEDVFGLLYLPAGAMESPPMVLALHGGPTGQSVPSYDPFFQFLLTRGIAIFALNFRGSSGYGKRFTRLDNRRLRPNAVRDMEAALDYLQSTGRVDASRAGAMGGSYGGFMALAALTEFPDRFKAGVSRVGVSNWVTALEGASPELKASDRIEFGDIENPEDREFLLQLSPITHVDRLKSPVLVIHGANDPRDPVSESDRFVAAVRERGGHVDYLRFPDEGHRLRKLSNQLIAHRRTAMFLLSHLADQ